MCAFRGEGPSGPSHAGDNSDLRPTTALGRHPTKHALDHVEEGVHLNFSFLSRTYLSIAVRASSAGFGGNRQGVSVQSGGVVAANLDRFARGEKLENIVLQT